MQGGPSGNILVMPGIDAGNMLAKRISFVGGRVSCSQCGYL